MFFVEHHQKFTSFDIFSVAQVMWVSPGFIQSGHGFLVLQIPPWIEAAGVDTRVAEGHGRLGILLAQQLGLWFLR